MLNLTACRMFLLGATMILFVFSVTVNATEKNQIASLQAKFAKLERTSGGRLGVYAVNTGNEMLIGYRADERFPMCSTFKVILAAAILGRSTQIDGLLHRRINYEKSDLVAYSPISEKHVSDGMTISELCAAALQYSDNTSANLLMKVLGGPSEVTAYARSIGNSEFRLDRWETELNTCFPGDLRDTATPATMTLSLRSLALGNALPPDKRKQLNEWLRGNTTGGKRIRAAIPAGWQIGDKTGSGDYGTTNDIAVLNPPGHKPIVLSIYYTREELNSKWRDDIVAAVAQIVVEDFGLAPAVK